VEVKTTRAGDCKAADGGRLKLGGSVLLEEAGSWCPADLHVFTILSNPLTLQEQVHPMSTTAWAFVIADPPSYQASESR
jgi:hypothetical protein